MKKSASKKASKSRPLTLPIPRKLTVKIYPEVGAAIAALAYLKDCRPEYVAADALTGIERMTDPAEALGDALRSHPGRIKGIQKRFRRLYPDFPEEELKKICRRVTAE